ncbi:hypothetical protein [Arthrobacter koreensis]|uniref:hypothetical protein n=1 Tax=Arthrobacter koreensis TaxID=199136 RepID=UPI002DBEC5B9|nr:hypothetical protein [Arthrobacter koreensis]MEB7447677.1 hypothetical protein [Arthrobacter koreensis]
MAGGDVPNRPTYLGDSRLDDVARMVFELTSELWILKDRVLVLEDQLQRSGALAAGAVDAAVPDEELAERLGAERRRLAARVYGAVLGSDERVSAALS